MTNNYFDDFDDFDAITAADLRAEDLHQRRYSAALCRHPDPRDPDYPGDLEEEEDEALS